MRAYLAGFLILLFFNLTGKTFGQLNESEKGIIIYDPSNLGDDFTVAKTFKSAAAFGVSTTVEFSDGTKDQILNKLIRNVIPFPTGSALSQEYITTADSLKQLAATYPRALNILSANESLMRAKAAKLGRIEALRAHQAKQVGRVVSFSDNNGEAYENVTLREIEPDGITINAGGEPKKLSFTILPKEIQDFLGYDPVVASDYALAVQKREEESQRLAAAQAAQAKVMEARRREAEAMAAAQAEREQAMKKEQERVRPIIEIESDLSGFIGKAVSIQGEISIDSYYNYEYDTLRDTHFCFSIRDKNYDHAHVYAPKDSQIGVSLRDELLKAGGGLSGRVTFQINPNRLGDNQTSILADLIGYGPPNE
ncbi:hypothetical protein N9I65_03565 [bacterium]|nr:hypothetical protein [bacterium]